MRRSRCDSGVCVFVDRFSLVSKRFALKINGVMTMEVGEKSQRDDDIQVFNSTKSGCFNDTDDYSDKGAEANDPVSTVVGENDPRDDVEARVECSDSDKDTTSPVTNGTIANPESDKIISEPVTPQQPLTFTINFGDDKEVDTARYKNLFERYNARHRRNLSASKVRMYDD